MRLVSIPRVVFFQWPTAVVALVAFGAIGWFLASYIGGALEQDALEDARSEANDSLVTYVVHELNPEDMQSPLAGQRYIRFDTFVRHVLFGSRTQRVKIWNRNSLVIYSTDPSQMGQTVHGDGGLDAALAGTTTSRLAQKDDAEREAAPYAADVDARTAGEDGPEQDAIEVYAPLIFRNSGEIVGAAELYQPYAPVATRIASLQRSVMLGVGVGLMAAYVLLMLTVANRNQLILRQRDQLRDRAGQLEESATRVMQSERRLSALVQNASDAILVADEHARIGYQSPSVEGLWGYAPAELAEQPLTTLAIPEDHAALQHAWQNACREPGSAVKTELRTRRTNGERRTVEWTVSNLLAEPAIGGMVVTAHDVTERRAFEQQLADQAFHDPLTGLANRALLYDRLERALTRTDRWGGCVGLLFIDLDNFKLINDSLGHEAGDQLLVAVADRLRACTRAENTVARLGGDEFTIVLDRVSGEDEAVRAAERVAEQFGSPFYLAGQQLFITVSVGIALSGPHNRHLEGVLRDADLAMYRAKALGKAQHVVFDSSMHTEAASRLELEKDLRHAIEHGDELRLHYQPIVLLDSASIVEVEALVRWQHPRHGLLAPQMFIPIAEETGLIVPLGRWVLREACGQVRSWHDQFPADPPLTLSVNLSPREFSQPSLLDAVSWTLQETGFPSTSLRLEITEGVLMRDADAAVAILHQLKGLGIQIAVDDFGTGYSSLAYLKHLPLDIVKIDGSFIEGLGQSPQGTAIVRAIVSLAQTLDLTVVAEGVEAKEQAAHLRSLDCERGQGYYFAPPDEPDQIALLLEAATQSGSSSDVA